MLDIHLVWEGPYTPDEARSFHSNDDFGIYQYYGEHILYGINSLLYLGKAEKSTFGSRISQHKYLEHKKQCAATKRIKQSSSNIHEHIKYILI